MRYYRPTSLSDALAALASEPDAARLLVGGTDLLVALRHRTVSPQLLVDLKSVPDIRDPIAVDGDRVTFGPTATMAQVAAHPVVREWFPGLVEAAVLVGSVAIRNRASLIANSANGSPAADTSPVLLALGAEVTIMSSAGDRTVPLSDFFVGPRRTRCGPGEIVTAMRVGRPVLGSSSAFERMTRRRGVDLATCSIGVVVSPDGGLVAGLGAVGPTTLLGGPTGAAELSSDRQRERAIDELLAPATPISDVRSGAEYRGAMLRVMAGRAVSRAIARRDAAERTGTGGPNDE